MIPRAARSPAIGLLAVFLLVLGLPTSAEAQGRGNGARASAAEGPVLQLSAEVKEQIRAFYGARPASGVDALPPGIRRRLERGKPLPPGIAMKHAPSELRSHVGIPVGYDLVEVGLDVVLVHVATGLIHDALMDAIR